MALPKPSPPEKILPPNRWARRVFIALPLLGIAIGYIVDNYAGPVSQHWLHQQNELDPAGAPLRNALFLSALLGCMIVPAFLLTGYFWLLAFRIKRTNIFPPRGYPIVDPTPELSGPSASRKANMLFLYGTFAIAIAGYLIWAVFTIFPETAKLLKPLYG